MDIKRVPVRVWAIVKYATAGALFIGASAAPAVVPLVAPEAAPFIPAGVAAGTALGAFIVGPDVWSRWRDRRSANRDIYETTGVKPSLNGWEPPGPPPRVSVDDKGRVTLRARKGDTAKDLAKAINDLPSIPFTATAEESPPRYEGSSPIINFRTPR